MVKKVTGKRHMPSSHDTATEPTIKKPAKKKASEGPKKMSAREREELLIENFVGLQHAMTNLSVKFGSLSDNISELLHVFETAAKKHAQRTEEEGADSQLATKLDTLIEQNKLIAKGLVLMEGKIVNQSPVPPRSQLPQPLPPQPGPAPQPSFKPQPLPQI